MKINGLKETYKTSFDIMSEMLGLDKLDVELNFEYSKEMTVGVKGGKGYIRCSEVHHMNRLLALFAEYYKGEDFEISETPHFKTLSIMLDVSFGGPISLDGIKEYLRYSAAMGYNQLWFYAEDMYEMPEKYKHFGYMRGRYSVEELRELDDYAYSIGIEIVPCIQTLGHMGKYLRWREAAKYRETAMILKPGDPEVDELIRDMLVWASKPFRSKRIHVGLDEASQLGLGASLKRDGYRSQIDIFLEHVNKVAKMCSELGLKPMMWNDLVFCFCSKNHSKYDPDTVLTEQVLKGMPKNMELVYWNYEDETCGKFMIEKNREIGNPVIFGGGVWIFGGALPDNVWSGYFHERALADCKEMGVEEVCHVIWCYGTTIYQTSLLETCRYAEHAYEDSSDKLPERFEFITGASYDAFYDMSNFHALYKEGDVNYDSMRYDERFYGNKFMWQDIMLGLFDEKLYREPRSGHYAMMAEEYRAYAEGDGKWRWLYDYCYRVFDYLAKKCYIAERIAPAYKSGDNETLRELCEKTLPTLENCILELQRAHMVHKDRFMRPFGTEVNDKMYGTVLMRTRYAIHRLSDYLSGNVSSLPELAEPRYDEGAAAWGWGFDNLSQI